MTRPPPADPPATPDPPDTRQTTPPTESYRHPQVAPRDAPLTATRRARESAEPHAEPSPSDQARFGPEVELPAAYRAVPSTPEEQRALLSTTAKSPVSPPRAWIGGDINTTQRSPDEPSSSPRSIRDDGRTSRLEEQLSQLNARVRLLHKVTVRLERLVFGALVLGAVALAFALFW